MGSGARAQWIRSHCSREFLDWPPGAKWRPGLVPCAFPGPGGETAGHLRGKASGAPGIEDTAVERRKARPADRKAGACSSQEHATPNKRQAALRSLTGVNRTRTNGKLRRKTAREKEETWLFDNWIGLTTRSFAGRERGTFFPLPLRERVDRS